MPYFEHMLPVPYSAQRLYVPDVEQKLHVCHIVNSYMCIVMI